MIYYALRNVKFRFRGMIYPLWGYDIRLAACGGSIYKLFHNMPKAYIIRCKRISFCFAKFHKFAQKQIYIIKKRCAFFTYVFLSLSDFRLFRRYSRGYGHGRRHGHDTAFGACRRRGTKDRAMRQPVFLFADERVRFENARGKRVVENAGRLVDRLARVGVFRARHDACRLSSVFALKKGVRRVFDSAFFRHFVQNVHGKK